MLAVTLSQEVIKAVWVYTCMQGVYCLTNIPLTSQKGALLVSARVGRCVRCHCSVR